MFVNLERIVVGNVRSNFLKSMCTKNFMCATFYQHLSIFRIMYMKCVPQNFLKENLCTPQVSCVCSSHDLCAHAHSLQGTLIVDCYMHQQIKWKLID